MKKNILLLLFVVLLLTNIAYGSNFLTDIKKYTKQEVTVIISRGNRVMTREGIVKKVYDNGILLINKGNVHFINLNYIIEVYQNKFLKKEK